MPKSLVFESVETFSNGSSKIRFRKTVAEGEEIFFSEPHIHQVDDGESVEDTLTRLEACLSDWPAVGQSDRVKIAALLGQA